MTAKTGLLLVNLGSPDTPTPKDVRRYLFQFLHDKRVIDTSRWIWCPILHGIILRVRPAKSAAKYASIWNEPPGFPGEEAPLVRITRAQAAALQDQIEAPIAIGMRYGNPSIDSGLSRLASQGCDKVGVLPLYPQFSHTTTSAVQDVLDKANGPTTLMLEDYYGHSAYISALAENLKSHIESLSWRPDVVLASYHGLPQRYVDQGDPYADQCKATTSLIREALGQVDYDLRGTFQSRFGPMEWLQPYTDKTLLELARDGQKNVVVMTPGFPADCLETLEEIALEARHEFLQAGGENFSMVPCLNTDDAHIRMLAGLARALLKSASA